MMMIMLAGLGGGIGAGGDVGDVAACSVRRRNLMFLFEKMLNYFSTSTLHILRSLILIVFLDLGVQ